MKVLYKSNRGEVVVEMAQVEFTRCTGKHSDEIEPGKDYGLGDIDETFKATAKIRASIVSIERRLSDLANGKD